jgi:Membrane protease subunits, stomatin/prohibitin homologs
MDKIELSFLLMSLVGAVVSAIVIIAIVIWNRTKKNQVKAQDLSDDNLDFLNKSENGREILEKIRLSQTELKRAKLDEDTAGTHERVIEIEKRILDLDREVTEARLRAEPIGEKNAETENKTSAGSVNHIGPYREGSGNLRWWIAIIFIALAATAVLLSIGLIAGLIHTWYYSVPIILSITAIWTGVVILVVIGRGTIHEGYVGLVTEFKKYVGSVDPGLFFAVPLINEWVEVYLGQLMQELNLTDGEGGSGSVDLSDGTPVGVKAKVTFRIVKERAQLAIFNTMDFSQYLSTKMDGLIRSFLSCYAFNQVNTLKGNKAIVAIFSQNYLGENGTPKEFKDIIFGRLEEADVREALTASSVWQAIRRDWGIEILDLIITDYSLPKNMEEAREKQYLAEQNLLEAKKGVETAEQLKFQRIQGAQARNAEIDEEGKGFAKSITETMAASGAKGERVLEHVEKRLKYSAVEKGANVILSDGSSRFIEEGVGFGAGESIWENRKKKPDNIGNQKKGMPI